MSSIQGVQGPSTPASSQASQVVWLLRFARRSALRLGASTAARVVHQCLGGVLLALPAWQLGRTAVGLPHLSPWLLGLVLVVLALAKALLRYTEQLLGHLAAFALMGELRVWILGQLVPRAPAVVDGGGAARVQAIAHRDVGRIEVFFAHTIAPAVSAVLVPLASVAAAGALAGARVATVLGVVQLLGWLLPLPGARRAERIARESGATRTDISQHVADTMRTHDEVLSNQAEELRLDGLARLDDELAAQLRATGRAVGFRQAASTLRVWLGSLVVLLAGVPAIREGHAALAGVLAAVALVAGTAPALETVERLARSLPAGLEATRRLRELAASSPTVTDPMTTKPSIPEPLPSTPELVEASGLRQAQPPAPEPAAQLDHVTFTYPGRDEPVLRDVTLHIRFGEVVGVCGATGSGKSTLARLLQRWYDPSLGTVSLNGTDVRQFPLDAVRRRVVVADQDPHLFDDSLRANLLLGAPDATEEEVSRALHTAALTSTVERRPDGLDACVGPRGARLSGGERQRLALARALLRCGDDALLVLDEATSHQDPQTQQAIVERLAERPGPSLVVAHRLEVLRGCDTIVVLEQGRVVEQGTWNELVGRGGAFAALLAAQG